MHKDNAATVLQLVSFPKTTPFNESRWIHSFFRETHASAAALQRANLLFTLIESAAQTPEGLDLVVRLAQQGAEAAAKAGKHAAYVRDQLATIVPAEVRHG